MALVISYRERTHVSDVRIRLAETLAQQAAVAIDNAMLFRATEGGKSASGRRPSTPSATLSLSSPPRAAS